MPTPSNHWLVSPVDLQISRLEDIRYAGSEDKVGAVTIAMANGKRPDSG